MRPEELASLMERAQRSLRSAENLIQEGDYDFAVSRAYFAMFYAAKAALLYGGIKRSRHSGIVAAFGHHLVKRGIFPAHFQKMLQEAFEDRSKSDYEGVFPSRDQSNKRLADASELVAAVKKYLQDEGLPV